MQVVNLLVTPEQAEILNLATQQTIQLVLRNPTDREIVKTPGASTLNLFAGGRIRAPRIDVDSEDSRPKPQQYISLGAGPPVLLTKMQTVTIEVFSGSRRVESTFRNPDAAAPLAVTPGAVNPGAGNPNAPALSSAYPGEAKQ